MNKLNRLMLPLALVALVAVAVGCSSKQKKAPENPTDVAATQPAAAMEAAVEAAPPTPVPPTSGAFGLVRGADGQAVSGVSVMIPELNAKHPVNADGTFTIELEPTNKMLTLIFSASGHKPTEKKISVPQGQPVQLSIVLQR